MKFSIGDKVLLKRTGEEGVVTAYISKEMVEVEVNGTTFPTYLDEVDHPYLKWFTDKDNKKQQKTTKPEQLPVEKPRSQAARLPKGVYLSFLPVFKPDALEDVVDKLKVHIINEMQQPVYFKYDVQVRNSSTFRHEGRLQPFGNMYLHTLPFEDMNEQPRFHWLVEDAEDSSTGPSEDILRIKPPKLFARINEMLQKNEPTFSYLLLEDFKPLIKAPKPAKVEVAETVELPPVIIQPQNFVAQKQQITTKPVYELDLHIEQLVSNTNGLSNADIVHIQLETLAKYIDAAIAHRQERMMVIHGLGKGVLRDEVHKVLKATAEVSYYTNEWQGQYGFGATEVHFKY